MHTNEDHMDHNEDTVHTGTSAGTSTDGSTYTGLGKGLDIGTANLAAAVQNGDVMKYPVRSDSSG